MPTENQALIIDRGWFMTKLDNVVITYMDARVNDASYERFLAWLARDIDEAPAEQRRGVVYETPDPGVVSAERRKRLAALLAARHDKLARITAGYVLVTPSAIARGVLTAIFWLAPPPYESHVDGSMDSALTWLVSQLPGLQPAATMRAYQRVRDSALATMLAQFG